jgi:putative pyrroloquinoline-quinone binding quinoprotein
MKRQLRFPVLALALLAASSGHASRAASPATAGGCAAAAGPGQVVRESRGDGFVVDACGQKWSDSGRRLAPGRAPLGSAPTIDYMTTRSYPSDHVPGGPIDLMVWADVYRMSDGSEWFSGAGTARLYPALLQRVELSGTTIRYVLFPTEQQIYQQTDYDFGDHSAQGSLGRTGPLVLEAEMGATTAVIKGAARITSNEPTWYGEPRFTHYTSVVGSVVPFQLTYTIEGDVWTPDVFGRPFRYSNVGWVDFAHPVSTPAAVGFVISGPPRVPDRFTTPYKATVLYPRGVSREQTLRSTWSVDPASLATINNGVLTTGTLQEPQALLTLRAQFVDGARTLRAEKQVPCLAEDPVETPDRWPMFQANSRHDGYLPLSLDPSSFSFRWERNLGGRLALNPVAAGEGKVFVTLQTFLDEGLTLFGLRASDGATLWSRGFGRVFSVNPPAYAYGMVYVQTGNNSNDTWLRAFDGANGAPVFQAPHDAQWDRYLAPTVHDRKVYVSGGFGGGMYGFEGFSGNQLWFSQVLSRDISTPAVIGNRAYAYASLWWRPGLYANHRISGARDFFVPDDDHGGYEMTLAPVIGAHNDILVINDGRLVNFNTLAGRIRWQVKRAFSGQPSVARGRIYAIDGGRLSVLDERTHTDLWTWAPPEGSLQGPMIVTDTHLLVASEEAVYAVDLATHQSVWSYPVSGQLALADGTLYISRLDGVLTAITAH